MGYCYVCDETKPEEPDAHYAHHGICQECIRFFRFPNPNQFAQDLFVRFQMGMEVSEHNIFAICNDFCRQQFDRLRMESEKEKG